MTKNLNCFFCLMYQLFCSHEKCSLFFPQTNHNPTSVLLNRISRRLQSDHIELRQCSKCQYYYRLLNLTCVSLKSTTQNQDSYIIFRCWHFGEYFSSMQQGHCSTWQSLIKVLETWKVQKEKLGVWKSSFFSLRIFSLKCVSMHSRL